MLLWPPMTIVLQWQKSVLRGLLPRQSRFQPQRLVRKETREWTARARLPDDFAHGHGPREVADPPNREKGSRGPDRAVPRARRETLPGRGSESNRRRTCRQSPRGRLGLLVQIDAEPHEVEAIARQLRGGGEDPGRLRRSDRESDWRTRGRAAGRAEGAALGEEGQGGYRETMVPRGRGNRPLGTPCQPFSS